jgi:hypothetical protein
MVTRINATTKFSAVLQYNEKKVAQNKAELIHSRGFLQATGRLTLPEKLDRFARLHELNSRTQVNTLHISINFQPGENPSNQQMTEIADRYLEGLKLENQPALVYRHSDAGHAHLHIVTSLIDPDGARISNSFIGIRLSEPARQAIEKEFGLAPARPGQQQTPNDQQPVNTDHLQRIRYGTTDATQGKVRQIIEAVNNDYAFTTLPEYNAILRQYNVLADPGSLRSKTRQHDGLVYRMIDDNGQKAGPTMKASQFPTKPTLPYLWQKFKDSASRRKEDIPVLRHKIEWALAQGPDTLTEFAEDLGKDGILVTLHRHADGKNTLTYIHQDSKTAITDSDLGRDYTVEGLAKTIPGTRQQILSAGIQQTKHSTTTRVPQPLTEVLQTAAAQKSDGLRPGDQQQQHQQPDQSIPKGHRL